MKNIIRVNPDSCVGCNRCVRECPIELANITYQDETGAVKVNIDHLKCINCCRCLSVCKHNSRTYTDDTERFFNDLAAGIPISVIAAPSIRTNIPHDYKKLFTYLRNLGVKKIYDVALGADICIWAHIRYVEKMQGKKIQLITQPCPPIVSYCEIYRPELLKYLSPIHSPMACTSIYVKKWENINHRIASISPCPAKSDEFEATEIVQYNITFTKLSEYLKTHNIKLPKKESDFDLDSSGLGSILSMPGGLKENIEFYFGESVHIFGAKGFDVFKKLDTYAETSKEKLPDIFDVLSCDEGCNINSSCRKDRNIFEIDSVMWENWKKAVSKSSAKQLDKLYKKFDDKFNISDFIRKYRKVRTPYPKITACDIEKAFEVLGKTTHKQRNFDCGACGSETCYDMARKIAIGVNIPINCIVKDVEDLETALESVKTGSKAKGDFLSSMSHEMRTPMNAIIGMTTIGKRAADIEGKDLALKKIEDASSHLLGVINDVLDMAKIEADKLELAPIEYNFERLLNKATAIIRFRADEKQQTIFVNIDDNIPQILIGDDQRLSQIIINLLSNAVKFTPEYGKIELDARLIGKIGDTCELQIEVSDNGIGISLEQQQKLFQMFEQGESNTNRKYGGTGLGLAISKKIIELMGGKIWVESEFDRGAKFIFTVKVKIPQENAVQHLNFAEENDNIHGEFAGKKMLLAEDMEVNREIILALLEYSGLTIDCAENGRQALEIVAQSPKKYDIIFMDVQMPEMDGYQATRLIRALPDLQGAKLPIIAMTANVFKSDIEECLAAGMNEHIGKPVDIDKILEILRKYL